MANDQQRERQETPGVRTVHQWLQTVMIMLTLAGMIGSIFVYKDRQDRAERDQTEDRKAFVEFKEKQTVINAAVINQQGTIEDFKHHIADKTIHVSEDQLRNTIMNNLKPIGESMVRLETMLPYQQKQLDRVEELVKKMDDNQQRQLKAAGESR
jgi:predicted  nucleic acid-binding Zn-ribbon protein